MAGSDVQPTSIERTIFLPGEFFNFYLLEEHGKQHQAIGNFITDIFALQFPHCLVMKAAHTPKRTSLEFEAVNNIIL